MRWAGALAAGLMLVACGGATKTSSSRSGQPRPVTSAPPRTTTVAAGDLRSKLAAPPAGYSTSTRPDAMSGPITPAQFDQQANQPGASATFNFLDGYDQTYDTADTSESIEVLLADFTTQAGATSFAATNAIDPSEAPTQSSVPAIPGATALDSTKPDKDGLYSHVITASRGTRAMVIQYAIDSSGAAPAVLMMLAVQQYSRL